MAYASHYDSPLGTLLLTAEDAGLTGVWFRESKALQVPDSHPVLDQTKRWLDLYFDRREPDFLPPLCPSGTPFQEAVWQILAAIPYGQTVTYGEIAKQLAARRGIPRMSAQAVGGAVGKNPISILIPCHRVVGTGGNLTGYAGGLDKKIALLTLEGLDISRFSLPKG